MTLDDDEPIWLTTEQVIVANRRSLNPGEVHKVLDQALLEGALHRPVSLWQYENVTDLFVLGARITIAVAKAHAFQQGNKRTGFQCGLMFLMTNGMPVEPLDVVEFAQLIEAAVENDPFAEPALAIAYREYAIDLLG